MTRQDLLLGRAACNALLHQQSTLQGQGAQLRDLGILRMPQSLQCQLAHLATANARCIRLAYGQGHVLHTGQGSGDRPGRLWLNCPCSAGTAALRAPNLCLTYGWALDIKLLAVVLVLVVVVLLLLMMMLMLMLMLMPVVCVT